MVESMSNENEDDDTETQHSKKPSESIKIDPITAVQESIDGLSLAMFEALRGLRDAVAPESGNLGLAGNDSSSQDREGNLEVEELFRLYCSGDEDVTALVRDPKFNPEGKVFRQLSEFVQWHDAMEQTKDSELVERLASAVLEKSNEIDYAVDHKLPGMDRTRTEQMAYLAKLIEENADVATELGEAYEKARARRDQCRNFVIENTGKALGIDTK